MIALFHEKVSSSKDRVTVKHFKPERLTEEQRAAAIFYEDDAMPVEEIRPGKSAVLYVNTETKELWVEYEDRPLSQEELLMEISSKLTTLIEVTKAP